MTTTGNSMFFWHVNKSRTNQQRSMVADCSSKACRQKKRMMLPRTGQKQWTAGKRSGTKRCLPSVMSRLHTTWWALDFTSERTCCLTACTYRENRSRLGHRERRVVAGGFGGTPPVLIRRGVRRAPATASIGKSTINSLCPDPSRCKGPV